MLLEYLIVLTAFLCPIFQSFIPADSLMISIIQEDIIDADKLHLMWAGLYRAMYGTLVAHKHFMACA